MLYHYTDTQTAREIREAGAIRATITTLYRDLIPQAGRSREIGPVVWLTTNPIIEGTVWAKLKAAGWPTPVGNVSRIIVRADLCDIGLGDYADAGGIDYEWFIPMVQTGDFAGSHYSAWRLHDRDILAADWIGVEVLAEIIDGQTRWKPLE